MRLPNPTLVDRALRAVRLPPHYDPEDWRQIVWEWLLQRPHHLQAEPSLQRVVYYCRAAISARMKHELSPTRHPTDAWGRIGYLREYAEGGLPPEHMASPPWAVLEARSEIHYLRTALDDSAMALLSDVAAGRAVDPCDRERVIQHAQRILRQEETMQDDNPSCHATGPAPQGYHPEEVEICANCAAKLTCLPESIKHKLTEATLESDLEVWAHQERLISVEQVKRRITRREALARQAEPLPVEDTHTWEGLRDTTTYEALRSEAVASLIARPVASVVARRIRGHGGGTKGQVAYYLQVGAETFARLTLDADGWSWEGRKGSPLQGRSGGPRATFSKCVLRALSASGIAVERDATARRLAAVKQPKKRRGRPPKSKALRGAEATINGQRPKKRGRKPLLPDWWPRLRGGEPYPRPRKLEPAAMEAKLEALQRSLGANIRLTYGMRLVHRLKSGGDVVCEITPEGFAYVVPEEPAAQAQLDPEQVFSSLSSVASWAEGRNRAGSDYFSLRRHRCTEVWSADGRIIDRKGGVPDYETS